MGLEGLGLYPSRNAKERQPPKEMATLSEWLKEIVTIYPMGSFTSRSSNPSGVMGITSYWLEPFAFEIYPG